MAPATTAEAATITERGSGLRVLAWTAFRFPLRYGLLIVIGVISSIPVMWMVISPKQGWIIHYKIVLALNRLASLPRHF